MSRFEKLRRKATDWSRYTNPCLSKGSSTSTRSADIRAVLISSGKPRLKPPGFFGANKPPPGIPQLIPAAFPPASRFRVIFGRDRPPPEMSHPTVRRIVVLPPVNTDDIPACIELPAISLSLSLARGTVLLSLNNCYKSELGYAE